MAEAKFPETMEQRMLQLGRNPVSGHEAVWMFGTRSVSLIGGRATCRRHTTACHDIG